jgi:hypothetical protein
MAVSKAKMQNLLDGPRPGEAAAPKDKVLADGPAAQLLKGLQLSEITFKPLEWFTYNPDNEIFLDCKTEKYFEGLKKDIREANVIINPVIATQEGLLIEGESRHIIASQLCDEGLKQFEKIPCRTVLSRITKAEIKERLYLGNLSRFDIPNEVKLLAYAEIWPDYFLAGGDGRDGNAVTTRKAVAKAAGKSESQIKRDKAVIKKASEIAEEENAPLQVKHIKEAQSKARGEGRMMRPPSQETLKSTDACKIPEKYNFLKAAVILFFQELEYPAARLLVNHFLKKNEKEGFIKSLPKGIQKKAEFYFTARKKGGGSHGKESS